jgi:hypothetical protein
VSAASLIIWSAGAAYHALKRKRVKAEQGALTDEDDDEPKTPYAAIASHGGASAVMLKMTRVIAVAALLCLAIARATATHFAAEDAALLASQVCRLGTRRAAAVTLH